MVVQLMETTAHTLPRIENCRENSVVTYADVLQKSLSYGTGGEYSQHQGFGSTGDIQYKGNVAGGDQSKHQRNAALGADQKEKRCIRDAFDTDIRKNSFSSVNLTSRKVCDGNTNHSAEQTHGSFKRTGHQSRKQSGNNDIRNENPESVEVSDALLHAIQILLAENKSLKEELKACKDNISNNSQRKDY